MLRFSVGCLFRGTFSKELRSLKCAVYFLPSPFTPDIHYHTAEVEYSKTFFFFFWSASPLSSAVGIIAGDEVTEVRRKVSPNLRTWEDIAFLVAVLFLRLEKELYFQVPL